MRVDVPLKEITTIEMWQEVQRLRSELQTHTHLNIGGNAQILTGGLSGIFQSTNFVSGSDGCQINWATGDVEFNSGIFRGALIGNSLEIGTNGIHIDTSGNMWWGASSTYAGATIKISSAGLVNLTTGTFSGTLSAVTGTFASLSSVTGAIVSGTAGSTRAELAAAALQFYDSSNKLRMQLTGATLTFLKEDASAGWSIIASDANGLIIQDDGGGVGLNMNIDTYMMRKFEPQTGENDKDIGAAAAGHRFRTIYLINSPEVSTPSMGAARAHRDGDTQNIPSGTTTKIGLDTENYDVLGEFDIATLYRFTASKAGYYLIVGSALMGVLSAEDLVQLKIYKNGASHTVKGVYAGFNGEHLHLTVSDIIPLAVDEYIELYIRQNTGSSKDIDGSPSETYLSIHRIS